MNTFHLTTPLTAADIDQLHAGDAVFLTGVLYTARDAAHKRLCDLLDAGEKLPVDLAGQVIYYAGPAPQKPGQAIGSVGPTTSYRMDAFAPTLMAEVGLKGMIGKGRRSAEVRDALCRHHAVYFGATGGAAALLSQCVRKAQVTLYPELGPEAVRRLEVEEFPVTVINDVYGRDLYDEAAENWKIKY